MEGIDFRWRSPIDNRQLNALHAEAFGHPLLDDDWRRQVERHSLGWVTATDASGLVGFVNVVWDGAVHAWLQDMIVAGRRRRQGIGRRLAEIAIAKSRSNGCEWLHVDFDDEHRDFYYDACGFQPTNGGLIQL